MVDAVIAAILDAIESAIAERETPHYGSLDALLASLPDRRAAA